MSRFRIMERLWLSGIGDAAWRRAAKIREVFGRQLFQCDVSDQVACNRPRVLDMLVDRLLLFALAAILLHPQLFQASVRDLLPSKCYRGKGRCAQNLVAARKFAETRHNRPTQPSYLRDSKTAGAVLADLSSDTNVQMPTLRAA